MRPLTTTPTFCFWTLRHSFCPSPSSFSVTESLRLGKKPSDDCHLHHRRAILRQKGGDVVVSPRLNSEELEPQRTTNVRTCQERGVEIPSQSDTRKLVVSVLMKGNTPACLSPVIKLSNQIYAFGVFETRISFTSYCAQRCSGDGRVYIRMSNVRVYTYLFAFNALGAAERSFGIRQSVRCNHVSIVA